MRPYLLALPLALLFGPGALKAQSPDEPLRLDDVLTAVRERNPRLLAAQASARAAGLREPEASTLPDPTLRLGIMNFGVPDLNTDMAMSMAPAIELSQRVPFPGKLALGGEIARSGTEVAAARAEEAWWEIRQRAASLFYDLYVLDRRTEVMRETLALLGDFQEVAMVMYSAGTGRQADVLRADVEVARMESDIRQLEARRRATEARLNALLDQPSATPLPTPELDPLPLEMPAAEYLDAWAAESRPLLAGARSGIDQARARTELAGRQIWPDLMVGLSYGQRDRGLGTERMASAMVGFTLPVHAGSRQHALRDEAAAMERMAEAEHDAWVAEVDARIGELLAELTRARTLTELFRDEVIPEARATVESAFSSYRVGTVDFMTLVDAQMTVNRYEGELFQLLGDYGKAVSALESVVGRTLPTNGPLFTEER